TITREHSEIYPEKKTQLVDSRKKNIRLHSSISTVLDCEERTLGNLILLSASKLDQTYPAWM
ncbi:hypothetical protein HispidOSU_031246, partial [Sigmodon hispidus]